MTKLSKIVFKQMKIICNIFQKTEVGFIIILMNILAINSNLFSLVD